MTQDISEIVDELNVRSRTAAVAALSGSLSLQVVAGVAYLVTDQGVAVPINIGSTAGALARITSDLPTATVGDESSRVVVSTLIHGIETPSLDIRADRTLFPVVAIASALANPPIGFLGKSGTGLFFDPENNVLGVSSAGLYHMLWAGDHNSSRWLSDNYNFVLGGSSQIQFGAEPGTLNARVAMLFGDFQVGAAGALATNVTAGFLDVPGMAGAPTLAPTRIAGGHSGEVADTTHGKRWVSDGNAGRWACLNRGGRGTAIASAATLGPTAVERPCFDYFHTTGSTAVDFIRYDAASPDIYAPIKDGEAITFYLDANLTFNNGTASPTAGTLALQVTGGAAALSAGARIQFRRDDTQAKFVEMWRAAP